MRTAEIDGLAGLADRMPGVFITFLLSGLWLSGLPPLGNFYAKYLISLAAEPTGPVLPFAITIAAILTLATYLRPLRRFLSTANE